MTFESEVHPDDPADQLRADIESAIAAQEKGGGEREPEPAEPIEAEGGEESAAAEEPADERERDELGRFKAKGESAEEPAEPEEKPAEAKAEPPAAETTKTETRPPPGFSVASKALWDELPQSVRDDIAKREQEVDNGFKRYAGLGKFAEEAERNGTTLQNAVATYSAIETELKTNFVGALEFLCGTFKIDPRKLANVMAARYGVVAPTQNPGQATTQNQAPQQAPTFDAEALTRQFHEIARSEAQAQAQAMRAESERTQIDSQIAAFGADPKNKFFANVRQDMAALVQIGKANTLEEAYQAALRLNPDTYAILQNEAKGNGGRNKDAENAASRARNAAKAVGGAPGPGTNPDAARRQKDLSLDDEIRAAVDAQMGQI